MTRRALPALLLGLALSLGSLRASADAPPDLSDPPVLTGFRALDRPTGMAEAGFGWLTLPGADVCSQSG
ncbi:MAG TPA: hypothetical protein VIW29_05335, partial [Polyangiaceae bacterium]